MSVVKRFFGRMDVAPEASVEAPGPAVAAPPVEESEPPSPSVQEATLGEHYVLRCKSCEFEHHIPAFFSDANSDYSVDPENVRITCVYGGAFKVSLRVDEFFDIVVVPESGRVLAASIALNMKPLHEHMLTHHSPIYLTVLQGATFTQHMYTKEPMGSTFVMCTRDHGVDIVGDIDVSKAEIPGISW